MSLTIGSNIAASIAHRATTQTTNAIERSISKLASGQRVQSARDDAASMAIGSRVRAQIVSLRTYQQNAAQSVSVLQTIDGAYARTQDMLVRMRSLAAQAQSSNLSATERGMLDTEYQQIKREVERMASATKFNGNSLLGAASTLSFSGTLVSAATIGVTGYTTADVNGDGIGDLIYSGGLTAQIAVEVRYGNSDGTYAAGVAYTGLGVGQGDYVVTGDFNGDGKTDIVAYHVGTGNSVLMLNNGNNGFTTSTMTLANNMFSLRAADMNNDGKTDIVGMPSGSNTGFVAISNGSGFTSTTINTSIAIATFDLGDVNNDGYLDIVGKFAGGILGSILNNGSGGFSGTVVNNGNTTFTSYTRVMDINGDGILDNVSPTNGAAFFSYSLGLGNGTFGAEAWMNTLSGANTTDSIFVDLNGDGIADLVNANSNGTVTMLMGLGNMAFSSTAVTLASGLTVGPAGSTLIATDMNHDGRLDLVVNSGGLTPYVMLNTSGAGYQNSVKLSSSGSTQDDISFYAGGTRLNLLDKDLAYSNITNKGTAIRAEQALLRAMNQLSFFRSTVGASINRIDAASTNIATMLENQENARSAYIDLNVAEEMTKLTARQIAQQAGLSMITQASTTQKALLQLFSGVKA